MTGTVSIEESVGRFWSVGKSTLFCHKLSVVFCDGRHTIGLQTQIDFAAAKPPCVTERCNSMNKKNVVPEAREGLNRFKMEAANEVGVTLKQGYNGDLTAKQAGSVGGQMVKKMIQSYETNMKG